MGINLTVGQLAKIVEEMHIVDPKASKAAQMSPKHLMAYLLVNRKDEMVQAAEALGWEDIATDLRFF